MHFLGESVRVCVYVVVRSPASLSIATAMEQQEQLYGSTHFLTHLLFQWRSLFFARVPFAFWPAAQSSQRCRNGGNGGRGGSLLEVK